MLSTLKQTADFLRAHDDYAVITHFKPDGDAYGCALGLTYILRKMGKRAFPVCDDPVETKYRFLPMSGEFTNAKKGFPFTPQTAVGVDVSDADRMGDSRTVFETCLNKAAIDHHVSNVGFAPVTLLDAEAAAAGELILALSEELGVVLDKTLAELLYTAIATDSGNFSFRDTRGDTMRAAAKCLDAGIDVDELTRRLFRARSLARTKLLGMALNRIEMRGNGRVAGVMITDEMFARAGAERPDAHSIVNYLNEIDGVSVGILCEQCPEGTRISFRSAGDTDVSVLAARFGGGGHTAASGAYILGARMEDIFEDILTKACAYLDEKA
ncbi:MAG: bifunctional oligoribonuclease/PAP phosphatase NrnA [Clostridia bacterium]|nr:bifunctional oligoribonuclease/PAP phosphatase NrnA [Clostridia bacterium]